MYTGFTGEEWVQKLYQSIGHHIGDTSRLYKDNQLMKKEVLD